MLRNHFMKDNLRFYWNPDGRGRERFEDLSQAYIRPFSNIASYQLDRNTFEAELLERNRSNERFTFAPGAIKIDVDLTAGAEPHRLSYSAGGERRSVTAGWVIDTTGRARLLARRRKLKRRNPIRHGAFFWWVDGLVDIEELTDHSRREVRLHPNRRATGHLPAWLATNHFMGEGFWFWVIPLQGKTSLGWSTTARRSPRTKSSRSRRLPAGYARSFPSSPATCRSARCSTTAASVTSPTTAPVP